MLAKRVETALGTDSSAAYLNVKNGYSRLMSYLPKWSGIDICWAHDLHEAGAYTLGKLDTENNGSDILTKPLKGPRFAKLRMLLGVKKVAKLHVCA